MKRQKYPARLGDLRVSNDLHQKILETCHKRDMALPDLRRAALAAYCHPTQLVRLELPLTGQIVPDAQLGNKVEWHKVERVELVEEG